METRKANIIAALRAFARQRPGLEYGNYGDPVAYRAEMRSILKYLHHAETLLANVAWRDSITADKLIHAAQHAYSGRLTIVEKGDKVAIDYCTGQYWPTEYRAAVCAVLSAALWDYFRDNMPEGQLVHNSETGDTFKRYQGMRAGDYLRHTARREFGRSIASRWFN